MKPARRIGRGVPVLALLLVGNLVILSAYAAGLRVNTTASMPLGVYRVAPYHSGPIRRDTLVVYCPSPEMLAVALPRRYLGPGACPGNVEPLLKHVAAVGDDEVAAAQKAISVNGTLLPNSGRLNRDCAARPLPHIPAGHYVLKRDALWLYAPVARSWDSRYFGPQTAANVIGIATPILIVGEGRACAS